MYYYLLYPLFSGTITTDEQRRDVMNHLSMVLDSPMESMVNTIQDLIRKTGTAHDEVELECTMKTMVCKSYTLIDSLPF